MNMAEMYGKPRHLLTAVEKARIIKMFRNGEQIRSIDKAMGLADSTVRSYILRSGQVTNDCFQRQLDMQDLDIILESIFCGNSFEKIAEDYRITPIMLERFLKMKLNACEYESKST